jgi:hypothetical protein
MPRILKDDHQGQMWRWVNSYPGQLSPEELRRFLPDLKRIDPEHLAAMVEHLRQAEKSARGLRGLLESELEDDHRLCLTCRRPVTGKASRLYCSDRCRVRAHRSRRALEKKVQEYADSRKLKLGEQ